MEDGKFSTLLIILAGLAAAFFIWKRAKDTPGASFGGEGSTSAGTGNKSSSVDSGPTFDRAPPPSSSVPTTSTGGGTSIGGGGNTTRSTGTQAPVTRGGPPASSSVPTTATAPVRSIMPPARTPVGASLPQASQLVRGPSSGVHL